MSEHDEDECCTDEVPTQREPLAQIGSQMTVPETPSPDLLEFKLDSELCCATQISYQALSEASVKCSQIHERIYVVTSRRDLVCFSINRAW